MARLYLGVQRGPFELKKLVAIKEMRQEIASDPHFFSMFVDEARIAARLSHPNVVHTYEVLDDAPNYYLVMEFLDGQSLLEIVRRVGRANIPLHDHIWILTQLLAGLHHAHELCDFDGKPLRIVHRDVSPSNVFVCHSGETKLLDFGIANAKGSLAATHHGELKGKLGYLAPEQCLGHPAGVQSDLYSVGVMLWEAVARARRVTGEVQAAQIQARIQGLEPPIEQVCPGASRRLVTILARALATKPEDRYASAHEFQQDLEQFLAEERSQAGPESVSQLLRTHFEQDRRELHRAVQTYIGAWERESPETGAFLALTERAPALSGQDSTQELRDSDDIDDNDEEGQTSQIPVDHLLLQATKDDVHPSGVGWRLRNRAADAWTVLQSIRTSQSPRGWVWPAGVVLAAIAALVLATVAISSRTTDPVASKLRVARPPLHTEIAASTRGESPPVGVKPEPSTQAERMLENVQDILPAHSTSSRILRARWRLTERDDLTHKPRTPVKRGSHAPAPAFQAIDASRVEPGMDFPVVAARRNNHRFDLENPYAP